MNIAVAPSKGRIASLQFNSDLASLLTFMHNFAYSFVRDHDKAADLTQDTLVKALAARDTFTAGTNLKAWAFMILRNTYYSDRRKTWRQAPWDQEKADKIPGAHASSVESALMLKDMLYCALALSKEMRDAIIAVCYLGYEYKHAARIFNVADGTMKSRVARGHAQLNTLLTATRKPDVDPQVLRACKRATQGLEEHDPYWPIARAYEELYESV